ncbi:MAG: nitrous oxide reductase accessory protein NosL [Aigarchaeota archaeon]|nr:nitrous oxide reductase accessory protein NosL [Candidatus Pelearchaeum maunauluense]
MDEKRKVIIGVVGVIIVVVVIGGLLFTSHSNTKPALSIELDREKCKRCGMLISDLRYAAAILVEGEQDYWKYDDIGEMVLDYKKNSGSRKIIEIIVFDYATKEPLDATRAWYVKADPTSLKTPMGFGVVALSEKERAEKLAEEYSGVVLSWSELLKVELKPTMMGES